jgi:hypothetical protein
MKPGNRRVILKILCSLLTAPREIIEYCVHTMILNNNSNEFHLNTYAPWNANHRTLLRDME